MMNRTRFLNPIRVRKEEGRGGKGAMARFYSRERTLPPFLIKLWEEGEWGTRERERREGRRGRRGERREWRRGRRREIKTGWPQIYQLLLSSTLQFACLDHFHRPVTSNGRSRVNIRLKRGESGRGGEGSSSNQSTASSSLFPSHFLYPWRGSMTNLPPTFSLLHLGNSNDSLSMSSSNMQFAYHKVCKCDCIPLWQYSSIGISLIEIISRVILYWIHLIEGEEREEETARKNL